MFQYLNYQNKPATTNTMINQEYNYLNLPQKSESFMDENFTLDNNDNGAVYSQVPKRNIGVDLEAIQLLQNKKFNTQLLDYDNNEVNESIRSLDNLTFEDFEAACNALTKLQVVNVQREMEQLQEMSEHNRILNRYKENTNKYGDFSQDFLYTRPDTANTIPPRDTNTALGFMNYDPSNDPNSGAISYQGFTHPVIAATDSNIRSEKVKPLFDMPLMLNSDLLTETETNELKGFLDGLLVDDKTIGPSSATMSNFMDVNDNNDDDEYNGNSNLLDKENNLDYGAQGSYGLDSQLQQVSEKPRTRKSRKRLLSEQEKRNNHTSSEKKRRHLIKTSFDNLVSKLPLDELKKQHDNENLKNGKSSSSKLSKFVVLDLTCTEIERLKNLNQELSALCTNSGIDFNSITV